MHNRLCLPFVRGDLSFASMSYDGRSGQLKHEVVLNKPNIQDLYSCVWSNNENKHLKQQNIATWRQHFAMTALASNDDMASGCYDSRGGVKITRTPHKGTLYVQCHLLSYCY